MIGLLILIGIKIRIDHKPSQTHLYKYLIVKEIVKLIVKSGLKYFFFKL